MDVRRVPGQGPKNAKIVLVGEAPGTEEIAMGEPFIGASGNLLNRMLTSAGINRRSCYITNVSKVRPPKNDFGTYYLTKTRSKPSPQLEQMWEDVRAEVQSISPFLTVALGGEALRALTGQKLSIDKWRGSIIMNSKVGKLLPTYHPAYILRMYKLLTVACLDMKKAMRYSFDHLGPTMLENYITQPTYSQVIDFLQRVRETDKLVFDIETIGRHVRCLGLATSNEDAICIPFIEKSHDSHWTEEQEAYIVMLLKGIFASPQVPKVAQNFPFDATILWQDFGIHCNGLYIDTLLLQHCLFPELPKSLDFLCSVYTDRPRYSDYDSADDHSTFVYNCRDCCTTFEVATRLEAEARESGVWDFYRKHVQPSMVALTRASNRGVRCDLDARERLLAYLEQSAQAKLERFHEVTGTELNPRSPKQVGEYVYGVLKCPPRYNKHTGKLSTHEDDLQFLADHSKKRAPLIQPIIDYRHDAKLLSMLKKTKLNEDDRLTTHYNVSGTVNGRISSTKNIWGEGGNLQNIPKSSFRRIFVPERGHTFIKADLSQAEVRVVAWVARMPTLIKRFVDEVDFDIHRWNASNIYRISEKDVSDGQRTIAKAGVHGGNYGLGPIKASRIFGIPYREAKRAIEVYRAELPELRRWWNEIGDSLRDSRCLSNPFGRKRVFLDRTGDDLLRSAYSFIPQSTVADIINRAFAIGDVALSNYDAFPVLQVHDEICFSCLTENLEAVLPIIKRVMEPEVPIDGVEEPLVIPCEITYGPNWYDQEEAYE